MDVEKAKRTFPCYKDERGSVIFDSTKLPKQAKMQDIATAYRICRNGIVDDKAFLPSYCDVHSKDMDLSDPSSFSTSCFECVREAKKRLAFFGSKNPQAIIAQGYINSESGYTLRHNDKEPKPKKRSSHIDWWIYEEEEPWSYFKEVKTGYEK